MWDMIAIWIFGLLAGLILGLIFDSYRHRKRTVGKPDETEKILREMGAEARRRRDQGR